VPDWLLERLAAGDLSERSAAELRVRLEADGESARLETLKASNDEILRRHPAASVAREVERRRSLLPTSGSRAAEASRGAWPLVVVGSAATLVLAVVSLDRLARIEYGSPIGPAESSEGASRPTPSSGLAGRSVEGATGASTEGLTAKGLSPHLVIYRRSPDSAERLSPTDRLHPGDTLQLAYVAAGQRFGVVASIDAHGTITLHLPEADGVAVPLDGRGETALPHAFELDDTLGFERFVFVTSAAPFDTSSVTENLSKKHPDWSASLTVNSLELEKSPP